MAAAAASLRQVTPQRLALAGCWTARGLGNVAELLADAQPARAEQGKEKGEIELEVSGLKALDSAGAYVLQKLLLRLGPAGQPARLLGLPEPMQALMTVVAEQLAQTESVAKPAEPSPGVLERLGREMVKRGSAAWLELLALLSFVGENALALGRCLLRPTRFRWRPMLFNLRLAGVDALALVGLMSFLLGVVVAYQGANQLRQYGANIFVADLIGLSMLREFAPLITAIIIAGRSGSAYAAQIGSMVVSEEIDAMRTLGLLPLELLVLPKLVALVIALPLLTLFADVLGVLGGMLMASVKLDVTPTEFIERFSKAVSVTSYLIGLGKAPVFAAVIVLVGCFQGFRAKGGADSVGRQTTRSVVQSIFLVISADALFSVAFSALDL
ncbi:MlaE family lipid ABC transporter permease subunit [Paucibacter sp. B2R-40]|uniref:ABC transporter permease n=1 Tax=Paucibacter sp. B2R-40 TaxID=2893554 RepID=UPI0021E405BC|nr:MlaE family lipid ABC transporter permease subunit [Paucibacter sp. B2R-40]MCV2356476.1 MlaE family lipid ABC transporter permease subunit [Paucibacter sp. B2R-40]